jgi:DNA polymerase
MNMETVLRTALERDKYKRLADAVKVCQACPLGTGGQGVPGKWIVGPRSKLGTEVVMILGEAPGGVEMARGEPFVGQSGELLRSLLKEVGLTTYYLSNIAKHQPGKQQAPDKVAVAACAPFLRAEFGLVKPTHLILLGGVAAKLVVEGQFKVGAVVNQTYTFTWAFSDGEGRTRLHEIPTLLLYHPSYFLRNRTSPWIQKAVREWKGALRLFLGDKAPTYQIEEVKCEVHN